MTIKPLPAAFVAGLLAGLILGIAGCHLHVHLGGTYNRDGADKSAPPIELVFPKEESKNADKTEGP